MRGEQRRGGRIGWGVWVVWVGLVCAWGCAEEAATDASDAGATHCGRDQDSDRTFTTDSAQCAEALGPLDCDDNDPTVSPNAAEVCDGKDNDCDGLTDEDLPPLPCPKAAGVCGEGDRAPTYACQAGAQDAAACEVGCTASAFADGCGYGPRYVQVEDGALSASHCDGADNDCDGDADEGCPPRCDAGTPCGGFLCGVLIPEAQCPCQATGAIQCAANGQAVCQTPAGDAIPSPFEVAEVPGDGLDNDCNGSVDDTP